jgi:hypothetical protein
VARFVVSVARHGGREILRVGVLVYRLVAARVWMTETEGKEKRSA